MSEQAQEIGTLSRRRLIKSSVVGVAGIAGLGLARHVAARYGLLPPDSSGVWGIGETLTYASQRVLMSHRSMAREFSRSECSRIVPVSGPPPKTDDFLRLARNDFDEYRLCVSGLVSRPLSLSLADLRRLPSRSQITHQQCEEGWSFIAEWSGVPLSTVLNLAGVSKSARYVAFFSFDSSYDSLDLPDAYHPQTLLALGLNGQELPAEHGAPVRLRVARQLGYKSIKYISRIAVVDSMKGIGRGRGSVSPDHGYAWYAGI